MMIIFYRFQQKGQNKLLIHNINEMRNNEW